MEPTKKRYVIPSIVEKYVNIVYPFRNDPEGGEIELKIIYKLLQYYPDLELISGDEWPPEWPLGGDFGEEYHPHVGFVRVGGEQFWIIDRESINQMCKENKNV